MNDTAKKTNNKPRNSNNKRRYSNNRNKKPKALTPARTLQKYDNLLEQYLTSRRKYFELFGRANPKQMAKIEKNYQISLQNLRQFETNLKDWQKEVLKPKLDAYPLDRQFTSDNDIVPEGEQVSFVGEFEDPHLLPTQKSEDWSADTQESQGTIDDYNSYKGIVAS